MTRFSGVDLEQMVPLARRAVHRAARIAMRGFRTRISVEHKGTNDLVTRYDRDTEDALRAELASTFPYRVVGEETGGTSNEATFYVDPIDGTTNFVHGHPFWCTSLGFVVREKPVLGVVLAPALGCEWVGWASPDGTKAAYRRTTRASAFLESEAGPTVETSDCRVTEVSLLSEAMLATGFPYDRRTSPDNNLDAFASIKLQCLAVRRCGAAAIDLCLVADGTYDGYWERKLRPWDMAGGAAIVLAAGGQVTDYEGRPARVTDGHIVATNGALHPALLGELQRVGR